MERYSGVDVKDLIFVIESPNPGSCKVKGIQPAEHFNVKCPISSDVDYAECRDTIMVFIGSVSMGHKLDKEKIEDLQSRGNIILNDPKSYCAVLIVNAVINSRVKKTIMYTFNEII